MDTMKDTKMQPATDAVIEELRNRIEAAEKERDDAKAAAENIALKLDYLRSKLETAEHAQNDWLRANAPGGWIDNLRIENEALRAKITEMEKQAPTHWSCNVLQADASWKEEVGREIPPDGYYSIRDIKPLYALPGAKGEEK